MAAASDLAVAANLEGDGETQQSIIDSTLKGADAEGLGVNTLSITTQERAAEAITAIQTAIGTLGEFQGRVGAAMNRLSFAIAQGQAMSVSVPASESRIRDANIAEEAARLTKFNILIQSGLAALGQANQTARSFLQLLR